VGWIGYLIPVYIKDFTKNYLSTWDHETLYADGPSEDETILIRPLKNKQKNTNMVVG
jgi:hypothetical protein